MNEETKQALIMLVQSLKQLSPEEFRKQLDSQDSSWMEELWEDNHCKKIDTFLGIVTVPLRMSEELKECYFSLSQHKVMPLGAMMREALEFYLDHVRKEKDAQRQKS